MGGQFGGGWGAAIDLLVFTLVEVGFSFVLSALGGILMPCGQYGRCCRRWFWTPLILQSRYWAFGQQSSQEGSRPIRSRSSI